MDQNRRTKSYPCGEDVSTMSKDSRNLEFDLPITFKTTKDQRIFGKCCKYRDSMADAEVERLFAKHYEIKGEFSLPPADTLFTETAWHVDHLASLKRELNETKSKLNDYDLSEWNYHTRRRNKASGILWRLRHNIKVEYLTQAWCKFYENACLFPLIPESVVKSGKCNSVHLCEAPGAFVAALNHWLKSRAPEIDWSWLGVTLNPHYEGHSLTNMVRVDSLINRTENNWFYGVDNTGNLMDLKNLDALVAKMKNSFVNLVTADGSVDCVDTPAEQEQVVSHLHYCEAIAALHLLGKGGSFLLKIFTIFENRTVCLIYLLACCFERIVINKPVNSREGNSELYVVCLGFIGANHLAPYVEKLRDNYENLSENSMFRQSDIPENFLHQIIDCSEFFKTHQCEAIFANIRTFRGGRNPNYIDPDIERIKQLVAERFIKTYDVRPLLLEKMKILDSDNIEQDCTAISDFPGPPSSYNSRRQRRDLDPKKQLSMHAYELDSLTVPNNGEKFKLSVASNKLLISTGRPYRKNENSKFCSRQVLHICNRVMMLGNEIGFKGPIPSAEVVEEFKRENETMEKILTFEYTSAPNNHQLIEKICDALASIKNKQSIVFLGYSMLSRLNVGLLYVLSSTFDSIIIEASEKLGCVVTLKDYKENERTSKLFSEILRASREAEKIEMAVLSILPITVLCDSSQLKDIVRMNHGIIKYCVHQIVSSSAESYENYMLMQR